MLDPVSTCLWLGAILPTFIWTHWYCLPSSWVSVCVCKTDLRGASLLEGGNGQWCADKCLTTGSRGGKNLDMQHWRILGFPRGKCSHHGQFRFISLTSAGSQNPENVTLRSDEPVGAGCSTPLLDFLTPGHFVGLFLQIPVRPLQALENAFWKQLAFMTFKNPFRAQMLESFLKKSL